MKNNTSLCKIELQKYDLKLYHQEGPTHFEKVGRASPGIIYNGCDLDLLPDGDFTLHRLLLDLLLLCEQILAFVPLRGLPFLKKLGSAISLPAVVFRAVIVFRSGAIGSRSESREIV